MSIVSAVLYGLLQGITEFLPVSSSGHLALMRGLLPSSLPSPGGLGFDILLHLSTLLAVLASYGRELFASVPAFFTLCGKAVRRAPRSDYTVPERTALLLVLGTLPLGLVLPFRGAIEAVGGSVRAVGTLLLVNASLLFLSDRVREGRKDLGSAKARHALLVGFSQALASLPGLSRSGTTVTFGLLAGMTREAAVRFSFLLSVPAVLGANLVQIPVLFAEGIPQGALLPLLCGMAAAAVSGFASVKVLCFLSRKAEFKWFGVWCVLIGAAALLV